MLLRITTFLCFEHVPLLTYFSLFQTCSFGYLLLIVPKLVPYNTYITIHCSEHVFFWIPTFLCSKHVPVDTYILLSEHVPLNTYILLSEHVHLDNYIFCFAHARLETNIPLFHNVLMYTSIHLFWICSFRYLHFFVLNNFLLDMLVPPSLRSKQLPRYEQVIVTFCAGPTFPLTVFSITKSIH